MAYLYLAIAIVAELIGTSSLNYSEGFTKLIPTSISLVSYGIAFYCLSLALVHNMPVNIAYAIWSGIGIVVLSFISVFIFHQSMNLPTMLGIGFIVVGVIMVNLFGSGH